MPVHDWTRVDAGLFHHFHQSWTVALTKALNAGGLPANYFALVEQNIRGPIPDVLTLKLAPPGEGPEGGAVGLAVTEAPPRARVVRRSEADIYAARANQIAVRHRHGDVVAVVEILSPGNKAGRADFRAMVEKSAALIRQGVQWTRSPWATRFPSRRSFWRQSFMSPRRWRRRTRRRGPTFRRRSSDCWRRMLPTRTWGRFETA